VNQTLRPQPCLESQQFCPESRQLCPESPQQPPPRSAYLHIPFCHRRCFYCDFPVVPLGDRADGAAGPGAASIAAYLELLRWEIGRSPAGPPLATVYFGGGTPSMLSPDQVGGLLDALRRRFGLAPAAEISLEMDPASFDRPRLAGYLAAGINRVSLGGQSFDDAVLARLGRRHRSAELRQAARWLGAAQRAGDLVSWSLDLIQGVPGAAPDKGTEMAAGAAPDPGAVLLQWRWELEQALRGVELRPTGPCIPPQPRLLERRRLVGFRPGGYRSTLGGAPSPAPHPPGLCRLVGRHRRGSGPAAASQRRHARR
jgi:hypothetical protein